MEGFGAMIIAHLPALFAMLAGYVLLVVEMCIPGFGLPGVLGSVLAVIGIVAMQPTPLQAFVLVVVYVALLCIALAICMHSAVRGRFAKSRFVLNDTATDADAADHNDLAYFIGKTGVTRTPLRPSGIAEFDGVKLSVVSEGEFVEKEANIRVNRVTGNRIVVSEIK